MGGGGGESQMPDGKLTRHAFDNDLSREVSRGNYMEHFLSFFRPISAVFNHFLNEHKFGDNALEGTINTRGLRTMGLHALEMCL